MSLAPRLSRTCARLRRVAPVFWVSGLALLVALGRRQRAWTGPVAFLLCAASVITGLAGLAALLFSEEADGTREEDPTGAALGVIGVLGAFATALLAAIATPSE